MSCIQSLTGIAKDCAPSMGGIVAVRLANKDDVSAVTVATNKITAITMASTGQGTATAKFKLFNFDRNTGSLTSNYTIDHTTGANFVVSDLLMVFRKMDTTKRVAISALAKSELVAIVTDANGAHWYLGFDEPLLASAGDGLTGTQRADRNGYSITLQDNSKELPYEILTGEGGVNLDTITE